MLHSQSVDSYYFTDGSFQLEMEGLVVRVGEVVVRVVMSKSILVRSKTLCIPKRNSRCTFLFFPAYQRLLRQRPIAQIVGLMLLRTGCLVWTSGRGWPTFWRDGQKAPESGCFSLSHFATGSEGSRGFCGVQEFVSDLSPTTQHF